MRLHAQRLYPKAPCEKAADIVQAVCGVNAQFKPAMMLAMRARIRDISPGDVAKLTDTQGTLVRTWAMRGTIHLLARDDPGWMLPLLGPPAMAKARGRRWRLGLDDEKLAKGMGEIRTILKDEREALTREELMDRLIDRGLEIERKSQAPYHLITYASLKGLIILGPDRLDGEQTYHLATGGRNRWDREETLAELASRYLMGYGPASPADFGSWSGLTSADAKKAWELLRKRGSLVDIIVENRTLGALETQLRSRRASGTLPNTAVSLLPAFDTLILGYSDRSYIVSEKCYGEVYHGGQTVPVVLVNGMVAGVWRYERRGKRIGIFVRSFQPFESEIKDLVEAEAKDIGRLFGLSPSVEYLGQDGSG